MMAVKYRIAHFPSRVGTVIPTFPGGCRITVSDCGLSLGEFLSSLSGANKPAPVPRRPRVERVPRKCTPVFECVRRRRTQAMPSYRPKANLFCPHYHEAVRALAHTAVTDPHDFAEHGDARRRPFKPPPNLKTQLGRLGSVPHGSLRQWSGPNDPGTA